MYVNSTACFRNNNHYLQVHGPIQYVNAYIQKDTSHFDQMTHTIHICYARDTRFIVLLQASLIQSTCILGVILFHMYI